MTYLGNTNTIEVHMLARRSANCRIELIHQSHRRYYATLSEARADRPYDNCHWCLGNSKR